MKDFRENGIGNTERIVKASAEMLDGYDWQYFATLTFRNNVNPDTAKALFRQCIAEHEKEAIFFLAVEWHRSRDCVHIHALIGQCGKEIIWKHGISKIVPYDKNLGARYYVSKFISHPCADWDFELNKKVEVVEVKNMERKRLTVLRAVRHKCLYDCSNGQRSEVRYCVIPGCPLFPYRFGKNPFRKGIGGRKRDVPAESVS